MKNRGYFCLCGLLTGLCLFGASYDSGRHRIMLESGQIERLLLDEMSVSKEDLWQLHEEIRAELEKHGFSEQVSLYMKQNQDRSYDVILIWENILPSKEDEKAVDDILGAYLPEFRYVKESEQKEEEAYYFAHLLP